MDIYRMIQHIWIYLLFLILLSVRVYLISGADMCLFCIGTLLKELTTLKADVHDGLHSRAVRKCALVRSPFVISFYVYR